MGARAFLRNHFEFLVIERTGGMSRIQQAKLKGLSPEAMAKVADMLQHIGEQSKKIAEQVQAIKFKDVKIERIMFELARLKPNRFGAKTERMNVSNG